jgi:polar amino acid transport system permease protein
MRAIPFLILAYLLYYGLPQVGISMEPGPPVWWR